MCVRVIYVIYAGCVELYISNYTNQLSRGCRKLQNLVAFNAGCHEYIILARFVRLQDVVSLAGKISLR